jgi:putative ABC transport system permease protein
VADRTHDGRSIKMLTVIDEYSHECLAIIEALTLSLIGGILGIVMGVTGSSILSTLAGWTTIVSFLSIFLAFSFSGLVGIFFGFYPAYKASLLNPIDALRYE